ncbi:MAG: YihY/virulence factor BrkB family protein [Lachnospiraceae bacterium]|nr:YihY/virulence factor BrkB family protein [Lachnospiraceae bacterium]
MKNNIKKVLGFVQNIALEMNKCNIAAFAASTAFFIFVSFVPMLIMICTIIPFTPLTEEVLVGAVVDVLPDMLDDVAVSLISEIYDSSAGILSLAIVSTWWIGGSGMLALIRGLKWIYGILETRNYILLRIISSLYTLALLVMVSISLVVLIFGNYLKGIVAEHFPAFRSISFIWNRAKFLFAFVFLVILFELMYTYLPNMKLRLRKQFLGAVFAAAGWSVFSYIFSLYVTHTGAYSIYGNLSIIVIAMFWLYCCMYIVMLGAFINGRILENRIKAEEYRRSHNLTQST